MHRISDPSILYFGTPVVLVGTSNANASYNLAPISSVFWLGWRAMIGISAYSKTAENLLRTRECCLNLPSVREAGAEAAGSVIAGLGGGGSAVVPRAELITCNILAGRATYCLK